MRIFCAGISTETNTFSNQPTGLDAFRQGLYFRAGSHPDTPTFFAGPLYVAQQRAKPFGWEVVQGLVAAAWPSGPTTRAAYEAMRDELLADLRAAMPVDIVALGLHGAMVADGYPDCEGDLLEKVREIVGPLVPVGATLDPHAHLTESMVDAADLLISWKLYPHTDVIERAEELITLLTSMQEKRIRPVHALVDCEMIAMIFTSRSPGNALVERLKAMEQRPGILSVSLNHGYPWGDVPGMGTKALVYTDGDAPLAQEVARALADEVIALRPQLKNIDPGIDQALDQALAVTRGTVVIADGADNAGAGSGSDSTYILRRMLDRGIRTAALAPLHDPMVVDQAFNAGVGARITVRLGGKSSPLAGTPIDCEAEVRALDTRYSQAGLVEGERIDCGRTALLDIAGIEVVVTEKRVQALGTDLLSGLGCRLEDKRIVVVKSSQHFYASFSKIAGAVLYANAPGTATSDWTSLSYRNIRRPIWPLDAA